MPRLGTSLALALACAACTTARPGVTPAVAPAVPSPSRAPAPEPVAEAPAAPEPAAEPPSPDGEEHYRSGGKWTACLMSRADLEAETRRPVTVAPEGGWVLGLFYEIAGSGSRTTMDVVVGLPKVPVHGQSFDVAGTVRHRIAEMGGGVEAGDRVAGTASGDPARLQVTLRAKGIFRRMFDSDDSIRAFSVAVKTVRTSKQCGAKAAR